MKNLLKCSFNAAAALLVAFVVCLLSSTAFAQRGQCNVQAPAAQTSAAAAIERAQITSALQAQPVLVQARPGSVTSASATANSGAVSNGPSVAALRAAVPVVVQSVPVQVQSAPILVQAIPSDQPILVASSGGGHREGLLSKLGNLGGSRRNTTTSKSVAITRTSTR